MLATKPTAHAAFLTDSDGKITTWNASCVELFGIDAATALGRTIATLLTPPSGEDYSARWPRMPDQVESLEVHIASADGQTRPSTLTLVPQRDGAGTCQACIAFFSILQDWCLTEGDLVGSTPLNKIVNALAGTFYVLNQQGQFALWNNKLEQVAEMSADELRRANALDMFDDIDRPLVAERIRQVFEEGAEILIEANYFGKSGKTTPYMLCGTRIECGGTYYLCGMGLDMSERREQEAQLRVRERALHAVSNGIVITRCAGEDNPIEYVNPAFERISGYRASEVMGRDSRFMAADHLDQKERGLLREAIHQQRAISVVFRNQRKDGEVFWNELSITPVADERGTVTHFIGTINDVTAQMQRTAHLEHEVNHDPLTGLANRNLMWDRLEQAIHMAQRNKTLVATVLVDLDDFKLINDTRGHETGDEVIKVIAKRLEASVRDSDTVARLSGDEFVLVLANQPSLRFTLRMVERLRLSMSKPAVLDQTEVAVSASMGVAVFPHDGATAFELVRAADVAMYHAKATGKRHIHFFSEDMKSTTEAKQRLETTMRGALDNDEIFLLFQPKLRLETGRIAGIEALLRWRHPEQGVLLPSAFLCEAEESGLIVPIGKRVLERVCALLRRLRDKGLAHLPVSMNASFREFSQHNYINQVADTLGQWALPPSSLELEFTEEHLLRNPHLSREVATQLHDIGMKLAIDNFGEGMTSLSYLQKLPVDHIKIARTTIAASDQGSGVPLAKTLIDIGHNLNIGVIAEGVETRQQMEFLKVSGCDEIQGRYFSGPVTAEAIEDMLKDLTDTAPAGAVSVLSLIHI